MSNEIVDPTKLAIGFANHIYDNVATVFFGSLDSAVKSIKVAIKADFPKYIAYSLARTGSVRTLVHPDEPTPLEQIYVPLSFTSARADISDSDILSGAASGKKALIIGTAGSGKTVLLRYLNLSLIKGGGKVLPVFVELRGLNMDSDVRMTLTDVILTELCTHIPAFTAELLDSALKSGSIALILDGFDEIDPARRASYAREIASLASRYVKASITMTSRPEESLEGLEAFRVMKVSAMSLTQTLSLLEKLEYDPERKSAFMDRVQNDLFEDHEEFLSNPLMASMMLLTFSYHSEVPAKIHIFYQQAFETLYQRHDRSKGVYTRKSESNLPIDDFQSFFEHFCASTYIAEKFLFSREDLSRFVENSLRYSELEVSVAAVLKDMVSAVCLIQADGVYFSFIHRSFQEFFTAKFLSYLEGTDFRKVMRAIVRRGMTDDVALMLCDMNKELFERWYVVPALRELQSSLEENKVFDKRKIFSAGIFEGISIGSRHLLMANHVDGYLANSSMIIWTMYQFMAKMPGESSSSDEVSRVLRRISNVPALVEEYIRLSTSPSSWDELEQIDFDVSLLEKDEFHNLIPLTDASQELLDALDYDIVAKREYDEWKSLEVKLSRALRKRRRGLDDILSSEGNEEVELQD